MEQYFGVWCAFIQMCHFVENDPGNSTMSGNEKKRIGLISNDLGLDPKIASYVDALLKGGIETYESCQGGEGHAYLEPAIRFYGGKSDGFRALVIAFEQEFPVKDLRRFWSVIDGELVGPDWEMTFWEPNNRRKTCRLSRGHVGCEINLEGNTQ